MTDILIIEDNVELATLISDFLTTGGYSVEVKPSGEEGLSYIKNNPVKLLLLDIMLTGIDGFEVCSRVRETQNIPILIMSSKNDDESKIICLEIGADDYMEKPFTVELLWAKVKALIRRNYELREQKSLICIGNITIDTQKRQVFRSGTPLNITGKEYDLLFIMINNPDKVLKKEWLFDEIWGSDSFSEMSTLTVHIRWLREKLETDPKKPNLITTVWGIGYSFNSQAACTDSMAEQHDRSQEAFT